MLRNNLIIAGFVLAMGGHATLQGTGKFRLPSPPSFEKDLHDQTNNSINLSDEAFQRGIHFLHMQQTSGIHGMDETLGSGVCVLDIDNDNDLDIFAVGGSGSTRFYGKDNWWSQTPGSRLFENNGSGYFNDSNPPKEILKGVWAQGCATLDFNQDGYTDLIVAARGTNKLLINNQDSTFSTVSFGSPASWSTSISVNDINLDGYPDIYVGNYLNYKKTGKHLESNTGFRNAANYRPDQFAAQPNRLYINQSGQSLSEDKASYYGIDNRDGRTLSSAWKDLNSDGLDDLLVVNGHGSKSAIYLKQKNQRFIRNDQTLSLDVSSGSRSVALGSLESQEYIAVSTSSGSPPHLLSTHSMRKTHSDIARQKIEAIDELRSKSGWGLAFVDLNGDHSDDLYIANGFRTPDQDASRLSQGQPDTLLVSQGHKLRATNHIDHWRLSSRSVVPADLDNDGDKDLLISHNNGPLRLLMNSNEPGRWLGIVWKGKKPLTSVEVNGTSLQPSLPGYMANNDPRLIHRIADNNGDQLTVTIHDTDTEYTYTIPKPPENQYLSFNEQGIDYLKVTKARNAKVPAKLLEWEIIANRIDWQKSITSFSSYTTEQKRSLIELAAEHKREQLLLAFTEEVINSQTQELYPLALGLLTDLESEIGLPLLLQLTHKVNDDDLCSVSPYYAKIFIEEEALLNSKPILSLALLNRLMSNHKDSKTRNLSSSQCLIYALSESKSYRVSLFLEQLLKNSPPESLVAPALYALGELRETENVDIIKRYLEIPKYQALTKSVIAKIEGRKLGNIKALPIDNPLLNEEFNNGYSSSNGGSSPSHLTSCPRISTRDMARLTNSSLATLFNICSLQSIEHWARSNRKFIESNLAAFLSNTKLEYHRYNLILSIVSEEPPSGLDELLLGELNRTTSVERKIILMSLVQSESFIQSKLDELIAIYIDARLDKSTRKNAGDILIKHRPNVVLKHSHQLFVEAG